MLQKPTYDELKKRVEEAEREIFEYKRIEEDLKHQKKRLESLIAFSSLAIVAVDESHEIVSCNRDFERLFQYKEAELIGKNLDEIIAGREYIQEANLYTKEALRGETIHGSGKRRRRDGIYIDVDFIGVPIVVDGVLIGAYGIYRDLAEQKQAEKALLGSETFLQHIFDAIRDGISVLDRDLNVIRVNKRMEEMYASNAPLVGRKCYEVYQERSSPCPWCPSISTLETGEVQTAVVPYLYDDEAARWIELSCFPLKNAEGSIDGIIENVRDIGDRKRAEQALEKSERRYRELVEESFDGIFVQKGYKIAFANQRLHEMLGYEHGELLGLDHWIVYHPEYRELTRKRAEARMRGEKVPTHYEVKLQRKDGSWIYGELRARVTSFEGEPGVQVWIRDVSDRKEAEEEKARLENQLQKAQKLEALGTLGGGVAHDFNNLLMAIQGRVSLMMMNMNSSHPDYENLKGIEGYVESAANLTGQLLGFARGGKYEVKTTDINEIIIESSGIFGRTKKEIKVHKKLEEHVWLLETDQGQIRQTLMNLYVNAWQAMPGGGDLYIQTENTVLDEDYVKAFGVEPGRYVKVSVTDTGVGMDEATRYKIFEPFFTTKEMGRGTGLGLASAYGIIKNHGGIINVYSEKGEGATFNIYLPASDAKKDSCEFEGGEEITYGYGDETVLLVDDEVMIIEVSRKLLEKMGYTVLSAGSGIEAAEIYEENKEHIDIVILDMIMPGMGGSGTFDRLKEIDPDVKILLSSGYSLNGQAEELLERGCDGFIHKPFGMKDLSDKLRQILDNER